MSRRKQTAPAYQRRRLALIKKLGGKCVNCGSPRLLQFDHKRPRKWHPEALSKYQRIEVYERAAAAGKLCLRCKACHEFKSQQEGKGGYVSKFLQFLNLAQDPQQPF